MNSNEEQRDFVRIEVGGDVFFRIADPAQAAELENKIIQRDRGTSGLASEWEGYSSFELKVLRTMDTLEAKLDAVLDLLEEGENIANEEPLRKGSIVNLSASGLVFTTKKRFGLAENRIVELKVNPSGYLGPPVLTLAQVVYICPTEAENRVEVAVTYKTIGSYDRERLVGYTFRQMRREIQTKNKENPS